MASYVSKSSAIVTAIKPQWFHPFLQDATRTTSYSKQEVEAFAYDYFLKFQPFFKSQPEGNLQPGVVIDFSKKMKNKLGMAMLFERIIRLNENYFCSDPKLLPYTLFHELIHMWLYDCYSDPSHTKRFYKKMSEFEKTGLPIDPDVHIHSRLVNDSKYIYVCSNCKNRWYTNEQFKELYCGFCQDIYDKTCVPKCFKNPDNPTSGLGTFETLEYFKKSEYLSNTVKGGSQSVINS